MKIWSGYPLASNIALGIKTKSLQNGLRVSGALTLLLTVSHFLLLERSRTHECRQQCFIFHDSGSHGPGWALLLHVVPAGARTSNGLLLTGKGGWTSFCGGSGSRNEQPRRACRGVHVLPQLPLASCSLMTHRPKQMVRPSLRRWAGPASGHGHRGAGVTGSYRWD